MNRALLITFASICTMLLAYIAMAQTPVTPRKQPSGITGALVVATCGTLPAPAFTAGTYATLTVDVAGKLCTSQ